MPEATGYRRFMVWWLAAGTIYEACNRGCTVSAGSGHIEQREASNRGSPWRGRMQPALAAGSRSFSLALLARERRRVSTPRAM